MIWLDRKNISTSDNLPNNHICGVSVSAIKKLTQSLDISRISEKRHEFIKSPLSKNLVPAKIPELETSWIWMNAKNCFSLNVGWSFDKNQIAEGQFKLF